MTYREMKKTYCARHRGQWFVLKSLGDTSSNFVLSPTNSSFANAVHKADAQSVISASSSQNERFWQTLQWQQKNFETTNIKVNSAQRQHISSISLAPVSSPPSPFLATSSLTGVLPEVSCRCMSARSWLPSSHMYLAFIMFAICHLLHYL